MTKAFLLGAGLGTRLRPLTLTVPKPLVPVFHRPLATHALDHLAAAGIREVAINTHHLHEEWERAFPDRNYRDVALTFFHEPDLLETGGGIKNIASFIGSDALLVYNGDILTTIDLTALMACHERTTNLATLAVRSQGPARHLAVHEGQVLDIHHKLARAEGTHQFTGLYCLDSAVLDLIPPHEKISIIPAFLELAKQGTLGAFDADQGHWLDLGTREAYLGTHGIGAELPPEITEPPIHETASLDPTATVTNSWIGPHCEVGAGAEIRDSVLWPQSRIAPQARLSGCIVHSGQLVSGEHSNADL